LRLRVVSWNVDSGPSGRFDAKVELLRALKPDLALLQEVNRPVFKALLPHPQAHARLFEQTRVFSWGVLSTDLSAPRGSDYRAGCAVLGSPGSILLTSHLLDRAPFEVGDAERGGFLRRTMAAQVAVHGGRTLTACSFHARPAASDPGRQAKPAFHAGIARWLAGLRAPVVFGMDAGAPEVDHPDFTHTVFRRPTPAAGGLGEDQLLGEGAEHGLRDVLRTHLAANPGELDRIRAARPSGPVAVSHRTADRASRYHHIWATPDLAVTDVRYLYDEAAATGSDHAVVVADFDI
jgi:endonuclease/exonuclease/phosphatase family metal-dependent hydrolase